MRWPSALTGRAGEVSKEDPGKNGVLILSAASTTRLKSTVPPAARGQILPERTKERVVVILCERNRNAVLQDQEDETEPQPTPRRWHMYFFKSS